ncbi:MAG: homoserine O-acetyltransferase [Bacillota bacterium]|nr:homoserine O-acetyltransferase [Bacillota bacterium]
MNPSEGRFITGGENIYPSYEGDYYFTFAEPPDRYILESGMPLGPITVNYQTYGTLSPSGDNAVYLAHALTGGSLAGKHPKPEKESGWWEPLVGPGKAFDTDRYFVICSNVLGSCYGTTGPSSIDLSRGKNFAMNFPVVTIGDMVRVQKKLLDHLGVRELVCAAGGSMGGMQALQWAVYYPDMVRSVIAVACSAVFSPIGIAFNQAERKAIMNDPSWRQGDYYGTSFPYNGLSLARMIGTITYRSNESFEQRFGRSFQNAEMCNQFAFHEQFAVESYLNYQGEKVTYRFDPNSYLYLSKAMDLHDLGRGFTSFQAALKRVRCPVFLMGINTDILFYPQEVRGLAVEMRRCGIDALYEELKSPHGHDSFLIEFEEMEKYIKYCLSEGEKQ